MSDDNNESERAMEQVRELLGQGQIAAAQLVMEQAASAAEQAHGAVSFEASVARAQLGALMLALGDTTRAVDYYRSAVGFDPGTDRERGKRLLTLQSELAETLERAGRTDEAEQVHLDVLDNRAKFYGREHPGYAFGLEPYAAFLARHGQLDRARPLAQEAAENLYQNSHPRFAHALVLLAQLNLLGGHPDPLGVMAMPDELLEPVGAAVLDQETWPAAVRLGVLDSYVRVASKQLGPGADSVKAARLAAVQAARSSGDLDAQRRHLEALAALARERGETADEQHLIMALSLATEQGGDPLEAERLLREGVRLANDLGEARVRCHALRQLGIFQVHQKRHEGETVLRTALLESIAAGLDDEANLTRVALGVHLQHEGRHDEARELLTEAVVGLDPATNEAFTARNHLDALREGGGCGCGRGEQAYADTLASLVRPELPEGLLEGIDIGEDGISVRLSREPTEEEAALLDRVLRQALFRLRQASERN